VKVAASVSQAASSAATPALLAVLNSSEFRGGLRKCCGVSGIAEESAGQLLDRLHAMLYASELVHNFDGSFETDATIEIGLYNATEYFPSTWQLRYLGYYGPRGNPRWGYPASPEGVSEEGIFGMQPYRGAFDEPLTFAAASSRLLYVALNSLRVDLGNPNFGNVSAVFSPSFWTDAVIASAIDTGLWTMGCNKTYLAVNGSMHWHLPMKLDCGAADILPAGTHGAMDHVLLRNRQFWHLETDTLSRAFARSYGDAGRADVTNVSSGELDLYVRPQMALQPTPTQPIASTHA
jgi:hypothetical protein